MRHIIILLLVITVSFTSAQNVAYDTLLPVKRGEPQKAIIELSTKGISPFTAFLLMDWKQMQAQKKTIENMERNDSILISKYGLMKINNNLYANAFFFVKENYDTAKLSGLGFLSGSKAGQFITGLIPIDKIESISNLEEIQYIQIGERATPMMDNARAYTGVNEVHKGVRLPRSYFGKDVVIGIIDGGFDYTHLNFYDTLGSFYRVKRVWDQNATTGTPPSGFSYGKELTSTNAILNAQYSHNNESHGTHVAGIAGGSGSTVSTTKPFRGVAPMSDLVFVAYKPDNDPDGINTKVFDGIAYIMNYAESVGKPCVINMSLGQHFGPHDGTSPFDQCCDYMVGPGRLLVGSAGNEGNKKIYINKSYTSSNNTLYTFLQFPLLPIKTNGIAVIDIWGVQGHDFQVAVNIYNTNTNSFENWTPYFNARSNSSITYPLYDADFFKDECIVKIASEINPLNNKPHVGIVIDNTDQDDSYRWVLLEIKATSGQTNMWINSPNTVFTNNGKGYPWVNGTTNSTVCEIGGTGKSIISVGAYTSKNSWKSLNGSNQTADYFTTIGAIAPFSSKGPTIDGRIKPDITAPGNVIVSSVNHYDNNNYPLNSDPVVSGVRRDNTDWLFATMQGTSMSAPVVTGILALWLEAYPYLTPTQAKEILKATANKDTYTGTISANGSNTWGWGKINAQSGLQNILTKIPSQPIVSTDKIFFCKGEYATLTAPTGYTTYQWSNGLTTRIIQVTTTGNYSVRVANNEGYISSWSTPITITAHPNPPIPTISVKGNTLTSNATSGNQWYFNENIIRGAIQQTYTALQTGNYFVKVTNTNNCSSQSNPISVNLTGISETEKTDNIITVYPNPTNGELNLQFFMHYDHVFLQLYNIDGQLLKEYSFKSIAPYQIETLCMDNIENGIYVLRLLIDNNIINHKITLIK
jgi:subtilisin family serine protease